MKAVYLLLCFALRDSAASIFRRNFQPQMDTLIVQPLESSYVDQYHVKDTKMHQKRLDSSSESKEHSRERFTYDDISDYPSSLRLVKNWNSPFYSSVITQRDQVPYGDVIEWRGVQIATGPKSPVTDEKDIERIFYDAYQNMQHVSEEDKKRFHDMFDTTAFTNNEDVQYNATQLLRKHNYQVEEHIVKTDDGYYLTLFRIVSKQETPVMKTRPVVFLMHGLLGSADDWLLMGPEKSLAYLLSDAGYDVWLGNARGNRYSRRHVSKHESQPDFWQFSIDEIALHDLPAMIDYALRTTEQKRLVYVGHSQGTTAFFALASARPEYRKKIAMMYALAPMVYMTNTRSPLFRMIAPSSHFYERLQDQLGRGEFKPSKELIHTLGGNMCVNEIGCKHICSNVNFVMSGVQTANMDVELIPVILGHVPSGASTRQMKQYGQAVASHELRKYDYGSDINERIYGNRVPPKYNMTEVKVPIELYYSEEDWLAHPDDVEKLRSELPDVRDYYKVPEKHFSHMDFQYSNKAPVVVYKRLIDSMRKNYSY